MPAYRIAWSIIMANRSSHEIDILEGPIFKKYISFIIPLAMGYILQLLFNAADVIIVGQFAGALALAAVGSTTALVNLYLQIYVGLATGVNIEVAGAYATGNTSRVSGIVHTSVGFSFVCGIFFLVFGIATVKPMLIVTGTPEDILEMAALYLYIYCLGIPASVIYNFGAAILRSIGDTKRPMYYLIAAGVVNFVLNIVSVVFLHMGVAGVAAATTVSNYISALLIMTALLKEESCLRLIPSQINLNRSVVADIIKFGLPVALQNSLFTIPNIMIQSSVNAFGSVCVAGNSASQSLEGFQLAFLNANGIAAATFTSQHYSAGKYRRADRVMRILILSSVCMSITIGILFVTFKTQLLGLYNSDPAVIEIGAKRLEIIVLTDFLDSTMCVLSNVIRGMGSSLAPMVITMIFVCGFRMIWLLILCPIVNEYTFIIMAWPVSWILAVLVMSIYYAVIRRGFPREDVVS